MAAGSGNTHWAFVFTASTIMRPASLTAPYVTNAGGPGGGQLERARAAKDRTKTEDRSHPRTLATYSHHCTRVP
jgi:hypothetical protein